jgi:signal transduction histidine kinase
MLDDLGLIPALQTRLKAFMEETGIRVSLKAFPGIERLS